MRLKYQLRGLGIGIMITAALLMGNSDDGEVSAKNSAGALGIEAESEEASVQETYAFSVEETLDSTDEEAVRAESETIESEITESETTDETQQTQETQVVEETQSAEETQSTEKSQVVEKSQTLVDSLSTEAVTIKIVGGDDSGTVARKLQTAGLVENAKEYDAYLMQHGYDKKIAVGTVEIPLGSSWLEIAEKISGKK